MPRRRAVAAGLVEGFRALPVANVRDSMGRLTAAGARLRPMRKGGTMAGLALTVKAAPGDLVLGDQDRLLCVPFADAAPVLKATQAKFTAEQKQMVNIQAGTHDATWVDEQLRRVGCEFVD